MLELLTKVRTLALVFKSRLCTELQTRVEASKPHVSWQPHVAAAFFEMSTQKRGANGPRAPLIPLRVQETV